MVKKGFKYLIECKGDDEIKPLCIMLPKMSGYVKGFDETKDASFLIENGNLLKAYNKVWDTLLLIQYKTDLIVNQGIIKKFKK